MLESRAAASFVVTSTNERSRQMGSARTEGTAKTIEIVAKAIHMTKVLLIVSPPPAEQRTFGNFDAPLLGADAGSKPVQRGLLRTTDPWTGNSTCRRKNFRPHARYHCD